jgi:hypothetical protein
MAEARINHPGSEVVRAIGRRSRTILLLVLAAALLGLSCAISAGHIAHAQSRSPRLTIAVPSVVSAEVGAETLVQVRIAPDGAVPAGSFLRIRGLPRTVALSEGYSIAPGAWAVPLAALPRLRVSAPAGSAGRSEITFSLLTSDGIVLSEAKFTLVIAAPVPQGGSTASVAPPTSGPSPQIAPEVREQAMKLLAKGDQLMAAKDFSAAQRFYTRAAEMGLPEAAMAVAKRYDPDELARLGAVGLRADPELARQWYEKARTLGAPEADDFLRRISGR